VANELHLTLFRLKTCMGWEEERDEARGKEDSDREKSAFSRSARHCAVHFAAAGVL